jgi:hypothetical protein
MRQHVGEDEEGQDPRAAFDTADADRVCVEDGEGGGEEGHRAADQGRVEEFLAVVDALPEVLEAVQVDALGEAQGAVFGVLGR